MERISDFFGCLVSKLVVIWIVFFILSIVVNFFDFAVKASCDLDRFFGDRFYFMFDVKASVIGSDIIEIFAVKARRDSDGFFRFYSIVAMFLDFCCKSFVSCIDFLDFVACSDFFGVLL